MELKNIKFIEQPETVLCMVSEAYYRCDLYRTDSRYLNRTSSGGPLYADSDRNRRHRRHLHERLEYDDFPDGILLNCHGHLQHRKCKNDR